MSRPVSMTVKDARAALDALTDIDLRGLDEAMLQRLNDGRLRQDGYMKMEFTETIAKFFAQHHNGDTQLILLEVACFLGIMHHDTVARYHLEPAQDIAQEGMLRTPTEPLLRTQTEPPVFERVEEMLRKLYNSPRNVKAENEAYQNGLDVSVSTDEPKGRLVKVVSGSGRRKHGLKWEPD